MNGNWSFSNTIYPTEENFTILISSLVLFHGRKLSLDELNEKNFQSYASKMKGKKNFNVFRAQYATVFHMWGLYYIDSNGIFFITPLALKFYKGEIDYQTLNLVISARYQFPKPNVYRQPEGPLRPIIALIRVFKLLSTIEEQGRMTTLELNLFWAYIRSDNDVEDFVNELVIIRNSILPEEFQPLEKMKKVGNGMAGTLRIAQMAGIIEKKDEFYQLVNK
ncbi:MAG: hypothetical protein O3A74_06640 [archaeon]|nr:hypothetical protein [archaeon]MDA0843066.1 hypothetical protein [archaeon]